MAKPKAPVAPKAAVEQADADGMVKVQVARGRTVRHDGKDHRFGDALSLPADEVRRLRKLGYLTDTDGKVSVSETSGPALRDDPEVGTAAEA